MTTINVTKLRKEMQETRKIPKGMNKLRPDVLWKLCINDQTFI